MTIQTHRKHIFGVLGAFLALVILFSGVMIPAGDVALAGNAYVSDIHFYKDSDGYLREHFHVDQNFSQSYQFGYGGC
jgi:hypothetical protein